MCTGCRDSRRCVACKGHGKRIRVRGFLFFRREETVACKACRGSGECRMCVGLNVVRDAAPDGAARSGRPYLVHSAKRGGTEDE